MKRLWYLVAGLLLMIAQSSWQSPLQDTEEKSRSFKASQAEPLDDPRQLNEVKRHSQGTFTSDYSKYLDTRRAQDFVQWLMNTKRSGQQGLEDREKENFLDQLSRGGRHRIYNTFDSAEGHLEDGLENRNFQEANTKQELYVLHLPYEPFAINGLARRHAEYERHADGTYTSDISSYLEGQAAKEFIAWLVNGRGRRDFSEGAHTGEDLGRRHADGTFTSDYNKLLDDMATQEFLKWLINQKVTQRDLQGEYQ